MPIEFQCTGCGKRLRVGDENAGKKAKCPECGALADIPQTPEPGPQDAPAGQISGGLPPVPPLPPDLGNPFQSPATMADTSFSPSLARSKVRPPAIALIIFASLGLFLHASNFVMLALGRNIDWQEMLPEGQADAFPIQNVPIGGQMAMTGVALARTGLVIAGAIQMLNLRMYPLALTAVILAIVPCFSGCCCFEIPIGIWALVVLNNHEVRRAFE